MMKKTIPPFFVLVLLCLHAPLLAAQTPFERMDRDHDGQLSRAEFMGPPPAFRRMDRNGDGYLTLGEAEGTRLTGGMNPVRPPERKVVTGKLPEQVVVDTHNHLVGRRVMGTFHFERQTRIALESMNEAGVKLNLLLPMPQVVGQRLQLTFEDLQPVVEQHPDRFAALGGGGTLNVMIQQAVQEGRVTPTMVKTFDARALELVRKGVVGFGEMTTEHFSMNAHHPYETAPPDHPLFLRLADLAARHGLPIDLHMEAIPEEMALPVRFQSPPNPARLQPNIDAFGRLLAHNRKAKIIWVHLGWDNTGRRTVAMTRQLLAANPNLYMSIRIASGMRQRRVVNPSFPLNRDGQLRPEWLALFQEFPDRFLLGSDEIIKPSNDHASAGSILSTASLLKQLPDGLRSKIGYQNAYHIYPMGSNVK